MRHEQAGIDPADYLAGAGVRRLAVRADTAAIDEDLARHFSHDGEAQGAGLSAGCLGKGQSHPYPHMPALWIDVVDRAGLAVCRGEVRRRRVAITGRADANRLEGDMHARLGHGRREQDQ